MRLSYNISHLYQAGIYQRTNPFGQRITGLQLKKYLIITNALWAAGLGVALWLIITLIGSYQAQEVAREAVIERERTLELEINRLAQLHSFNAEQTLALAKNIQSVIDTASGSRRAFIQQVIPEAIRLQSLYRIPASATIGMACYESAYGQSDLAQRHHNFFGLKAFGDWKGARAQMPTRDLGVLTRADFRVYEDLQRGLEGYAVFLYGRDRYKTAFQHRDGPSFVHEVAAAGYCPDRNYTMMVCNIIARHNLQVLDLPERLPNVQLHSLSAVHSRAEPKFPFHVAGGDFHPPSLLRVPQLPIHSAN
jgi:flagellum-specific peptidoglycan hydrolase FlgJ